MKHQPRLPIFEHEYTRLIEMLDEPGSSKHIQSVLKILFTILFITGLRLSEALNMSYSDYKAYSSGERVIVDTVKTHTTRELLSTPKLVERLKRVLDSTDPSIFDSARGFVTTHGTRVSVRRAEKYLYPYMHRLETELRGHVDNPAKLRYNSHSFRVGYITRMTRHIPLTDVSYVVGHTNVETTLKYTRTNRDMSRFNRILSNIDL